MHVSGEVFLVRTVISSHVSLAHSVRHNFVQDYSPHLAPYNSPLAISPVHQYMVLVTMELVDSTSGIGNTIRTHIVNIIGTGLHIDPSQQGLTPGKHRSFMIVS